VTRSAKIINVVLIVVVVAATIAVWRAREDHHRTVLARTRQIGNDLVTLTNSTDLDRVGWGLNVKLREFLDGNTRVTAVELGDEAPPVGNQTAASRVFLTNGRGQCLGIRLREDFEKFHVVGFWMVNQNRNRTNR
jgi:hypothetical protein